MPVITNTRAVHEQYSRLKRTRSQHSYVLQKSIKCFISEIETNCCIHDFVEVIFLLI
jgi:hypothetical protein